MPFSSKSQQRYMFAAEARGELPKGTAKRWADHTKNIKKLPERKKTAYAIGAAIALKLAAEETKIEGPQAGKETRLKRNHQPSDFFAVRRTFDRASTQKKEVGTHVTHTPSDDPGKSPSRDPGSRE